MAKRENSANFGRNSGFVDASDSNDFMDAPALEGGDSFSASFMFRSGHELGGEEIQPVFEDVPARVKSISLNPEVAEYSGSGTVSFTPLALHDGPQFNRLHYFDCYDDIAVDEAEGSMANLPFHDESLNVDDGSMSWNIGSSVNMEEAACVRYFSEDDDYADRVSNLNGNDKDYDSERNNALQQSLESDLADTQHVLQNILQENMRVIQSSNINDVSSTGASKAAR